MDVTIAAKTWKAAAYVRLSREDQSRGESDSITGQRRIIADWASQRGDVEIVAEYADDGYSGADFERPAFEEMMEDAREGLFDTIVVKDLSRFGRSYLDCGEWVERKLPELGVRLYSISDDFDSMLDWDLTRALLFPIKNLINEMHVATTSEKVRTSLDAKRKRGECVANFAPYGYMKDPDDRHRLVVDETAAAIVRRIFSLRLAGVSASGIAKALNASGVPCPSQYKLSSGLAYKNGFCGETPHWSAQTVLRMLRNEVYTGTLAQGKRRRPNWRTKLVFPVPNDGWQRTRNAHEPIIDDQTFARVQALLSPDR